MSRLRDKLKRGAKGAGRRVVAVDFDRRQLRVAVAERAGGRLRITRLIGEAIDPDVDVSDADAVARVLVRALDGVKVGRDGVVMNVPRSQAVLKPLTLPPGVPDAEVASMVQFQMEKELPFASAEAVIDYTAEQHRGTEPDAGAPEGRQVLVAAVRLPALEYYRQIARSADVKLRRLGLRPYASARCVQACEAASGTTALVHLMADETEIDVLDGRGGLLFSRSAVVKVPPEPTDEARDRAVEAVVVEATRSLQSYHSAESAERIGRVLVAGGTGIEAAAAEQLARRTGASSSVFNPAGRLGLRGDAGVSAFMPAIGLAMEDRTGALPFDFLNPKRPPVRRDRRKIAAVGGAIAAAVVILGAVALGWAHLAAKQDRVDALVTRYNKLRDDNRKIVAPLGKRHAAVEEWVQEGSAWLDHWARLSALLPGCEDVYLKSIQASGDGRTLTLTVQARDSAIITRMNRTLREAGYDVRPGREATTDDRHGYNFTTTTRVIVPEDLDVDVMSLPPATRPADDASDDPSVVRARPRRGRRRR